MNLNEFSQSLISIGSVVLLLTIAVDANAQRRKPQALPDNVVATRDIPYIENGHERQILDLYVPKTEDQSRPPIVVWIHGGGWANGSKNGIGNCSWVLGEGYALASVGYRLTDVASFPAQLEDCKAAIKWLKKNAEAKGCDPNRMVVWGSSAGGHLVSMLGTTGDPNDEVDDLQGVIDWFGPSELLTMQKQRKLPTKLNADAPDSFESKLVGGPLQENPDKASDASPVTHVTADDTPFLIMHGDQDALVSLTQSQTLFQKLKDAGVPVSLHVLEGAGHGGRDFQSEESRALIREFLKKRLR